MEHLRDILRFWKESRIIWEKTDVYYMLRAVIYTKTEKRHWHSLMTGSVKQSAVQNMQMWLFSVWGSMRLWKERKEIQEIPMLPVTSWICFFHRRSKGFWKQLRKQRNHLSSACLQVLQWILILRIRKLLPFYRRFIREQKAEEKWQGFYLENIHHPESFLSPYIGI